MALSVRAQILAAIETSLRTITTTNGYALTVRDVLRDMPNEADMKSQSLWPVCFFWSGEEVADLDPCGEMRKVMELNVIIADRTSANIEQTGIEMLAAVEKCLTTTNARIIASATVDIIPEGNAVWLGLPDTTIAGGHCRFSVSYWITLGDPFTAA